MCFYDVCLYTNMQDDLYLSSTQLAAGAAGEKMGIYA